MDTDSSVVNIDIYMYICLYVKTNYNKLDNPNRQYLAFEKGLALSGLGGLPGGFSTHGRRK